MSADLYPRRMRSQSSSDQRRSGTRGSVRGMEIGWRSKNMDRVMRSGSGMRAA
ncbi:hypothetical protein [Nocardiopsis alba]|uniref:hypothetical protein n=1 Tax=Nocardiopsis alba TaxID=53437 RepID=UPI0016511318|nr:hypothetical protein [Nocardiopsis alba]